jgi:cation:H+ antiporter
MLNTIIHVAMLLVGFVGLIKGADLFVDGSSSIARQFKVPGVIIGLTIVAMGTSAPEAAVSISAAVKGNNGISIGNVLGSNIMNILLILGITSVITVLSVKRDTVRIDIPFMIFSTILFITWGTVGGSITRVT